MVTDLRVRRRTVLVFLVLVSLVLGAMVGPTSARAGVVRPKPARLAPAGQVVLGSSFRPIRAGVARAFASGDDLLSTLANSFYPHGVAPIVINDLTGTTTVLDPSCDAVAIGVPWVLMQCPQSADPYGRYDVELYSLADGSRQTVTPSPGVPYCSSPPSDAEIYCASPDAVGAYWIRWDATCYHCAAISYFQNIQTGEVRDDPTNATTFADLNSPTLAQETCPGVRLMPTPEYLTGSSWSSLTYQGQFALVTTADNVFLERCGTAMRRPLGVAAASNAGAIVWQTAPNRLKGLFLPSLQVFTIPLPSGVVASQAGYGQGFTLGLTSGALYMNEFAGTLWRTASPTALPLNVSQPRLSRSRNTLICARGSWRSAARFSYAWRVNGRAKKGSESRLTLGKNRGRRSVSCSVTAFNATGTTTAASALLHLR